MESCWHMYNYGTNIIGRECIFSWGTNIMITLGIVSTTALIVILIAVLIKARGMKHEL